MLTVSNAFHMSSATVSVCAGGLFWFKLVTMVLFMLCSAVLVDASGVILREVRWVCMMCRCSCMCLVLELV